jgi:hypothetical protein
MNMEAIEGMRFSIKLVVHIYDDDEHAITLQSQAGGDTPKFAELLMYCCFTLRILSNLGGAETRKGPAWEIAHTIYELGNDRNTLMAIGSPEDKLKLVEEAKPNVIAEKGVEAELSCSGQNMNFQFRPKGFEILGRHMDDYSLFAAVLLLKYLLTRRLEDENYLMMLFACNESVVSAAIGGKLSSTSHHRDAVTIAVTVATSEELQELGPEKKG